MVRVSVYLLKVATNPDRLLDVSTVCSLGRRVFTGGVVSQDYRQNHLDHSRRHHSPLNVVENVSSLPSGYRRRCELYDHEIASA